MPVIIQYTITASSEEAAHKTATSICYEQSVELPDDVLSDEIRNTRVGRFDEIIPGGPFKWKTAVTFPDENVGDEITQFLNVLFGNVSMFGNVQIDAVDWQKLPKSLFNGPKFGIDGVRELLRIETRRALSCTALKPLGSDSKTLADFAHAFATGGIDIIKDDHGLANQSSSPFSERLKFCTDAIREANEKTGGNSVYYPNITADGQELFERYEQAHEAGAGGVLVSPHLTGLAALHQLAKSDIPLPIMAHPSFSGSALSLHGNGLNLPFLYGDLWRALGADFSIYPNAGGRFSFTPEQCHAVNDRCRTSDSPFKSVFPTPGGGIQRSTIPNLLKSYGPDTVFLVGGSLYQHPKGVEYASAEIMEILTRKLDN